MAKTNRSGRDKQAEHFTKMHRRMMETDAWSALSTSAQAIYPFLKFEWRGPKFNNNGSIRLSFRQAAKRIGVSTNTAQKAFHDLQAKGFIKITTFGALGIEGEARSPTYELTELAMPGTHVGRNLFLSWQVDHEFPVQKHHINNPNGRNGRKSPSKKQRRSYLKNLDERAVPVSKSMTPCLNNSDVKASVEGATVSIMKTSLGTRHRSLDNPPVLSWPIGPELCTLRSQTPNVQARGVR